MRYLLLATVLVLAACADLDLWHGFVFEEEGITIEPRISGSSGGFEIQIES